MSDYQGTDDELQELLVGVYNCSRDWSAWQYGTMTEDDFRSAAETDLSADLIAWRDAAVAEAVKHPPSSGAVPVLPGGPRMRVVVRYVAGNPGCSKADAGRSGEGVLFWGSVERAIARGYLRQEKDHPGGHCRLYVTPAGTRFAGPADRNGSGS